MFTHHLKTAFRNLRKYKTQNIISIIGLAVGFACFAFSALWIRYEMSYDGFHPKADRIYRVNVALFKWNTVESGSSEEIQEFTPPQLANWFIANYPEIEDACRIMPGFLSEAARPDKVAPLYIDHAFCRIFDMAIPENFFIAGRTDRPAAVSDNLHVDLESIKQQHGELHVQQTFPAWPANTNIPFNMVAPLTLRYTEERMNNWDFTSFDTYLLIRDGVDLKALEKKLDKVEIPEWWPNPLSFKLTPLKQLRYKDPTGNIHADIKFAHIQIFVLAGLLVILCALFNHLTLYVTRVRMRLHDLALRKVNGATDSQIAATLYTDFLLVLLLSLIAGFMLMALLLPTFKQYATIGNSNINIYAELSIYAVMLIISGFVAGGFPVLYFRKQVLNEHIKGADRSRSRNLFRKGSLLMQLIISLGMMFCAAVFIKQIRYLHHTDMGINRRNIASVEAGCCFLSPPYADRIKQVPGIVDAIPIDRYSSIGDMNGNNSTGSYVDSTGNEVSYTIFHISADARFFDFFGVEIIEGEVFPNEFDNYKFILNETAIKEVGEFYTKNENFMGVARDFYLSPTTKVRPTIIYYPDPKHEMLGAIAYKYEEGMRLQTEQAVTQWLRGEFPDQEEFAINFAYMEDIFEDYFKSDSALLTLLSVMTLTCILIAVFGVYSLTSLTCRQRRKEIAIRKINGAEILDIMNIFFKEYLMMLFVAALVAFPAGYAIMKRWLVGYVKQTTMDPWLFVLIFLIVFVVIVFSIFSMVWRAANQNPAEVMSGGRRN